jgi:hypothetical protein
MRKEILMAGIGWISAGAVSIAGWLVKRSFENAAGLLATGLVVIIIGAWLLLLNKRLERLIQKFEAEAARRSQGRK